MIDDIIRSVIARGKPISAARAQALVEEIERLQADAVALREAIKRMSDLIGKATSYPEIVSAAHEIAADVLTCPHPGGALLAELATARRVIAAARQAAAMIDSLEDAWMKTTQEGQALRAALAAYDAARGE